MEKVMRTALACFLGTVVAAITAYATEPSWYLGLIVGAVTGMLTYHIPWVIRLIKRIIAHFGEYLEKAVRALHFIACWFMGPVSMASFVGYLAIMTTLKTFFPSKLFIVTESPIASFLCISGFLNFSILMLAISGLNTLSNREENFLHLHQGREQALVADSLLRLPAMYRAFVLMIGLALHDIARQILPQLRALIQILQRSTTIWCATNAMFMGGLAFAICRIQNLQGTSVVIIAVLFGLIGTIIGVLGSMSRIRQQQKLSE